jgi:hypothetical protein
MSMTLHWIAAALLSMIIASTIVSMLVKVIKVKRANHCHHQRGEVVEAEQEFLLAVAPVDLCAH